MWRKHGKEKFSPLNAIPFFPLGIALVTNPTNHEFTIMGVVSLLLRVRVP